MGWGKTGHFFPQEMYFMQNFLPLNLVSLKNEIVTYGYLCHFYTSQHLCIYIILIYMYLSFIMHYILYYIHMLHIYMYIKQSI